MLACAGVFAANTAHAQSEQSNCTFSEVASSVHSSAREQVSRMFDACAEKGWAIFKSPAFDIVQECYCNVKARDASQPEHNDCRSYIPSSRLISNAGKRQLHHYFGATLQYLPERTEENKDACFVAHCPDGKEPSGFNMNGETECATPSTAVTVRAIAMPAEGGSAAIMGATTASVILNTTATIVATPAEGWYVDRWEGDGGACDGQTGRLEGFRGVDTDEKSCSLPAGAGLTVTAHFALARVTVRAIAMPAEGGSAAIMGATTASVILNTTATIVATPAEGWYVDRWEGDGGACAGQVGGFGSSGAADTDEKSCSLAASAGLTVTAHFASALCVYDELPAGLQTVAVDQQIDACNAKGWGARKHIVGGSTLCHCNIKAWDGRRGDPARQSCLDGSLPPHRTSEFSARGDTDANTAATYYFGATLQHLPERTEGNKDDCFVARCPGATEPSGFNTGGETECRAPSGAVCGGLTPAKHFDGVVCVESCATGATLNAATNVCECDTGNSDDCLTPSEEVCAALTPPKFFDGSDCVDFATCAGLLTLNRQRNGCECRTPNRGTPSNCLAPNPVVCAAPAVRHPTANVCQCNAPNVGTGADCKAPSETVCGDLMPAQFFDETMCIDFVSCDAPMVLDTAMNMCAAPSEEVCADLMPAKFFDETMCVDFVSCDAPMVLNTATNMCATPSKEGCASLTPAKFFDETMCVDFVSCDAPMVLDTAMNTCVEASDNINLRLRIFLEGPLR